MASKETGEAVPQIGAPNGSAPIGEGTAPAAASVQGSLSWVPPLNVSGLFVTKEDLLAVLRYFVPHISDIRVLEGSNFLLRIGPTSPAEVEG